MKNPRQEYTEMYHHLKEAFGVGSKGWSDVHEHYSPHMYCPANRLNITGEYLIWKYFVTHAKLFDIPYYTGIDIFLKEYKWAVEHRISLGNASDVNSVEDYQARCNAEDWCKTHDVPTNHIRKEEYGYSIVIQFNR